MFAFILFVMAFFTASAEELGECTAEGKCIGVCLYDSAQNTRSDVEFITHAYEECVKESDGHCTWNFVTCKPDFDDGYDWCNGKVKLKKDCVRKERKIAPEPVPVPDHTDAIDELRKGLADQAEATRKNTEDIAALQEHDKTQDEAILGVDAKADQALAAAQEAKEMAEKAGRTHPSIWAGFGGLTTVNQRLLVAVACVDDPGQKCGDAQAVGPVGFGGVVNISVGGTYQRVMPLLDLGLGLVSETSDSPNGQVRRHLGGAVAMAGGSVTYRTGHDGDLWVGGFGSFTTKFHGFHFLESDVIAQGATGGLQVFATIPHEDEFGLKAGFLFRAGATVERVATTVNGVPFRATAPGGLFSVSFVIGY